MEYRHKSRSLALRNPGGIMLLFCRLEVSGGSSSFVLKKRLLLVATLKAILKGSTKGIDWSVALGKAGRYLFQCRAEETRSSDENRELRSIT